MSSENPDSTGLLKRLSNFIATIGFTVVAYIVSMAVIMALRGPIVASSGEGTFTAIFGAWVLTTLFVIGKITP